jgi:SAM-dependent methyltransferase
MTHDSSRPDFWETRYKSQVTPWDAGRVQQAFVSFAGRLTAGSRVLIPGCGSAYEAYFLAEHGFDVLAIDFSDAAVDAARSKLARFPNIVRRADFFEFEPGALFDVIYERAFLCALPPRMWASFADRVANLLQPSGQLAGYFYYDESVKGPPFGSNPEQLEHLLSPHFELIEDDDVDDSIPIFAGKERWQVRRRRNSHYKNPSHVNEALQT